MFLSKEIREIEILFPEVLAAYKHFIAFVKDNILLFFRRQPEGEKKVSSVKLHYSGRKSVRATLGTRECVSVLWSEWRDNLSGEWSLKFNGQNFVHHNSLVFFTYLRNPSRAGFRF